MKKIVDEHGQMLLVRTPNMQQVLTWCFQSMIPIALAHGIERDYEQTISDYLKKLYLNKRNRPWLNELLLETGVDVNTFPGYAFEKAATLIFKSKIVKK